MESVTGLMHIHTKYSFDGISSLDDVVQTAEEKGHSFMLITEHSDDFDEKKMGTLVRHCERLSSERMIVIPGLEIHCDFGRHVLALGLKKCITTDKPDKVATRIKESGGVAVLPHPGVYQNRSFIDDPHGLNGIEIWNTRHDGTTAPNTKCFSLLQELRTKNRFIFAFAGQDLHDVREMDDLCLTMDLETLSEFEILAHLKRGAFQIARKRTIIESDGTISKARRLMFDLASSARMVKKACGGS